MTVLTVEASGAPFQIAEKDIATLQADMAAGRVTSADLVRAYIARIDAPDRDGPQLRAVIAFNPGAVVDAMASDAERKARGRARSAARHSIAALKARGAEIVEISDFVTPPPLAANERLVLQYDFKHDLNGYLASVPASPVRTLSDLIAYNAASPRETALFGQELFIASEGRGDLSSPEYVQVHDELKRPATGALDDLFVRYRLDALIRPTAEPAFRVDTVRSNTAGGGDFTGLAAEAGYPHLTVPMGAVQGLPVGLSFIGPAWSDASMLALGYAFEQATGARRAPVFLPSLEATAGAASAFAPAH